MRDTLLIVAACCATLLLLVLCSVLDQKRELDTQVAATTRAVPTRPRHDSAVLPARRQHASVQPTERQP